MSWLNLGAWLSRFTVREEILAVTVHDRSLLTWVKSLPSTTDKSSTENNLRIMGTSKKNNGHSFWEYKNRIMGKNLSIIYKGLHPSRYSYVQLACWLSTHWCCWICSSCDSPAYRVVVYVLQLLQTSGEMPVFVPVRIFELELQYLLCNVATLTYIVLLQHQSFTSSPFQLSSQP